ncbi:MAG TPA: hypothetical protein VF982_01355 [Anaerolineales bacterium]
MAINGQPQSGLGDLEAALRARICSVCVDRNLDGVCHLEEEHECALFNSFPKIVEAVSSVRSDWIEDYVAAIRKTVCADCAHQHEDGFCRVRGEVRCVLDRYLMLIVQTIEEVQGVALKPVGELHNIPATQLGPTLQPEFHRGASKVVKEQDDA